MRQPTQDGDPSPVRWGHTPTYKEEAGGNYDGFIGAVKNYTYKSREDGGFDCTTELMAAGELLESLKLNKKTEGIIKIISDEALREKLLNFANKGKK